MPSTHVTGAAVRRRVRVRGVVQGVGFRPFVHRLADRLALAGHVGNDGDGVFAEVEGPPAAVGEFERRLVSERPPLARIDAVESTALEVRGERRFVIVETEGPTAGRTFVSPDIATCDECLREMFDPRDRRHRYPFVNCTDCGPRFTITECLPYDRPNTTMRGFALCAACEAEYHDPTDRRFHAQPIACAECGPRVWFDEGGRAEHGTDAAVAAAQRLLGRGAVLAVKGLGGYHLACDARSPSAVARLRQRKGRAFKPFAVMAHDLTLAARIAAVDDDEAARLTSPERPIVLLRRRDGHLLSSLVAPGSSLVGVMLPYTPLHHLLFHPVPDAGAPVPDVLVMTSGNVSDEPIRFDDADARERLGRMADGWLTHDRPIHVPCDDSVVRMVDGEELPIRRSRGYAPLPIQLPVECEPVLAVGGELKSTFCLADGHDAWMSQHIGDMGSIETIAAFERSNRQFARVYGVESEVVAADMHPGYHTRRWAEQMSNRVALVQHHHAHVAAVMAEHGVGACESVIGFAFDGTGYGTDGAIWGGEVLVADYDGFERSRHLRYVPMPGGDATIRKPYRAALAHLRSAGIEWAADLAPVRAAPPAELRVLERQLDRNVACVPTSSMGRLFDAVASILDVRHLASYEAQAAIELECVAGDAAGGVGYRFSLDSDDIDPAPVLRAIVADAAAGESATAIAAAFHRAVARAIGECADDLRSATGIDLVALTGGVFQNVLLLRLARAELATRRFRVITHRLVPPNDGGLALGQAIVAGRSRRRAPGLPLESP